MRERRMDEGMLLKAQAEDVAKYGDFVYELALDQAKSGYPTYADGIKSKEDFLADAEKRVAEDTSELWLFYLEEVFEGWISCFWIPEDRYLQCSACNIRRGAKQALARLMELLKTNFGGYTVYFGFPKDNKEAIRFLRDNKFQCIEEAWNNTFFFESYEYFPENENIVRISRDNYDAFRAVYHPDGETYWNCERILECLEEWTVLVYQTEGRPVGTVFFRGNRGHYEIFGMDYTDEKYREEACAPMLRAVLNHCKRAGAEYLTFFCETAEEGVQRTVREMGFRCVGGYVCYCRQLT